MQIKSYEGGVKYLESFIGKVRFEITPEFIKKHDPLERMRALLDLLDNPQDKFPSVLVGGTSGKSSTSYLISHILTIAGYKTGFTLSPHLKKINERIQINGKSISDEEFTNLLASILDSIDGMKKMKVGAPSYFEILIAMAFLYFAKEKVDIAVVEVGMGGEYDATNTLYPLVAVLTNVGLDHTNVLGKTVQKIAKTKAGIIKEFSSCHPEFISGSVSPSLIPSPLEGEGQGEGEMLKSIRQAQDPEFTEGQVQHDKKKIPIAVTGVSQPSVIKIVEDRRKEVGAKLFRLEKDFDFRIKKESTEGTFFDLTIDGGRRLQLNDLKLSLLGKHQVENASLAIETALQLRKFGFKVSEERIRNALETAFFPGRFEVITCYPKFISGSVSPSPTPSPLEGEGQGEGEMPKLVRHDKEKTIVLDGAHNPTKMEAFLTTLKKLYPKQKKIFVVGFKFDKDVKKMLKQIVQVADSIIITEFRAKTDMSNNASMKISNVKSQMSNPISNLKYRKGVKIITLKNSKMALDKALNILVSQYPNIDSLIVVTGSLYLVGEVRNML